MAVAIKSPDEVAQMRIVGGLAFRIVQQLAASCRAGMTTRELADLAEPLVLAAGAVPTMKGFRFGASTPFTAAACVCVNEEAFHALPGDRIIRDGDLVTIDLAIASRDGWHADNAMSIAVGEGPRLDRGRRLADIAYRATHAMIEAIAPGVRWADVVAPATQLVREAGVFVGITTAGHGIGRAVHELPAMSIPAVDPHQRLWPGMVFTVEPVILESTAPLTILDDGWTTVAQDRSWSAFEERTVAVTSTGVEVLTA